MEMSGIWNSGMDRDHSTTFLHKMIQFMLEVRIVLLWRMRSFSIVVALPVNKPNIKARLSSNWNSKQQLILEFIEFFLSVEVSVIERKLIWSSKLITLYVSFHLPTVLARTLTTCQRRWTTARRSLRVRTCCYNKTAVGSCWSRSSLCHITASLLGRVEYSRYTTVIVCHARAPSLYTTTYRSSGVYHSLHGWLQVHGNTVYKANQPTVILFHCKHIL